MILAAEIGLTLIGLMAILRGKMAVGNNRFVTGYRAIFLGMLGFLTIPAVFLITSLVYMGSISGTGLQNYIVARTQPSNITLFLLELIVVSTWATVIFGIGGWFNWSKQSILIEDNSLKISAEAREPRG